MRAVLHRVSEDIAIYARIERVPVTVAFVLRLLLITPGFQFVLSRRVQELLAEVPLVGRVLRRVHWWLTCLIFSAELALSEKTVATYRGRIAEKMGLSTNVELTRYAMQHGLVD
ncbi:MAG: hypothetical protein EOP85_10110 [Verrucomicrobiaceae bacterium]|nr:MAG: hypothetical protein EOP85_10110 [Verrucomicrobiaceae bacterium]